MFLTEAGSVDFEMLLAGRMGWIGRKWLGGAGGFIEGYLARVC